MSPQSGLHRIRQRPAVAALTGGQGLVGLVLLLLIVGAGLLAPLVATADPLTQPPGEGLLKLSVGHPLGTDELSRDIYSRTLYGIRTTVEIIAVAVPIAAILGAMTGLLASASSITDQLAQRLFDVVLAFPAIILGLTLAAVLGPGKFTVAVVIVISEVPLFGRLIRTQILRVRELPFVEAAEVFGASRGWILRRHILPNAVEPLGVQLALSLSLAVFLESAMSFIGIGVQPPEPSLGSILSDSMRNYYLIWNPLFALGPLLVVVGLVLGFLLVAQALGKARRG
jgi:peptide/nickel transport system permease protein